MPLTHFHPVIAEWFHQKFGTPTEVQVASWPAIMSGSNTLIAAPTGAGKTLAAFLSCIDTLLKMALRHELKDQTHVVYVSPLKALSNDVQKNLQQPLAEISEIALTAGCLYRKALGPYHPQLATILDQYAGLLRQTNRDEEAKMVEKQAAAIRAHNIQPGN